jgi:hypothetical protein
MLFPGATGMMMGQRRIALGGRARHNRKQTKKAPVDNWKMNL